MQVVGVGSCAHWTHANNILGLVFVLVHFVVNMFFVLWIGASCAFEVLPSAPITNELPPKASTANDKSGSAPADLDLVVVVGETSTKTDETEEATYSKASAATKESAASILGQQVAKVASTKAAA